MGDIGFWGSPSPKTESGRRVEFVCDRQTGRSEVGAESMEGTEELMTGNVNARGC